MSLAFSYFKNAAIINFGTNRILGTEANDFQNLIHGCISESKTKIIVDLTEVEYITSWGIGILVHAYTTTKNHDVEFCVAGVSEKVMEILKKVKMEEIFQIYPSVAGAV